MSVSNPSHLLLSRNPRSPAHPQLAPTLTSRHTPSPIPPSPSLLGWGAGSEHGSSGTYGGGGVGEASGSRARIFSMPLASRSGTPTTALSAGLGAGPHDRRVGLGVRGGRLLDNGGYADDYEDAEDGEDEQEEEEELVEIHPSFQYGAALPGRVRIIVNKHEFWCHREVLYFASPFFQGLLSGSWTENASTSHQPRPAPLAHASISTDTDVPATPTPDVYQNDEPQNSSEDNIADVASRVEHPGSGSSSEEEPAHPPSSDTSSGEVTSRNEADAEDDGRQIASVYLDAQEDGPDVEQILRELRAIPDPPSGSASSALSLSLSSTPVLPAAGPSMVAEERGPEERPISEPMTIQQRRRSSRQSMSSISTRHSRVFTPLRVSTTPRAVSVANEPALGSTITADSSGPTMHLGRTGVESEKRYDMAEVTVEMHEERALAFQDFLFWAYPHLECKVTWGNVEDLLALAIKMLVPALQKQCEQFLLSHASGRPVMAMVLAELHGHAELYREASRFVLDQPSWNQDEMQDLSDTTQRKLSQRRMWFLERLLKLGSIDVRKEYACRPDCPDIQKCQLQLDEKWRQAHQAVCRYGSPQPSVAFRCLRQLETFPTNPSLVMPHPHCQNAAKAWCASLFDRMFQPKVISSPFSQGTEKYWLFIALGL